ncbi:MAG: hypothetical protein AB7I44_21180 [Hyphomicrobiaceae bacterium]
MTNAFDLASLAQSGEPTEALPTRSRRRTTNPFAAIVAKVAHEKLNWSYPPVSAVAENGERSAADQMESGIRQAGNALDRNDKAAGGTGWKTILRKTPNDDGTMISISFTVVRRDGDAGMVMEPAVAESVEQDQGSAPRSRRNR